MRTNNHIQLVRSGPRIGLCLEHDVEAASTLPPEDEVEAVMPAGGRSVAHWDRYELLELLGRGGMGSVYKARDRRLDRTIAIKFLLGTDPTLTMRFLREARAQARIDHPNVCRVYEVGEIGGHAYIALQFVDGEPLHKAAARMSLDEKVAVMRDVAAAIQEAHRLGIVHRDVKPANIMVERTEDGRWFPVVMDFGLAREVTIESGITESGALLGTPAYMSPEQARGDIHAIDRRSDVYSLGATFYELLTGRPPFLATSLAEALSVVIHDDPPAPRSLVPSLPVDLETIALKSLAKDPRQRYSSARALADDLGCYLAGEPILGRRLSRWQRVRLRVRRHRAVVVLGAWWLAILVTVTSLGLRVWISSRSERALTTERTRMARQLGQDAKEIELDLRTAYQLPLHDTRPDRERVRARMSALAATPHDLGDLGDAVVHEALGRGHLALHQWREAADEFGRAASSGLQTPELHAALGQALGVLYQSSLEEARRSDDKAWFTEQQHKLEQQYLTPALAELAQSRTSGESAALLEALVALDRREFAAAEQRALAVAERAPGLSEARKLAADAAYGAAAYAFDQCDYGTARLEFERAATLYAQAFDVARSDAAIYRAAAETWLQIAEIDARQERSPRESLERALDIVDRALRADPDNGPAYTTKAYVVLRWYRTPSLYGQDDQRPLIDRITQAAERAVELDPNCASAWHALGNAHVYRGSYEASRGGQGVPWWNRALDEFGKALAIQPNDSGVINDAGGAHRWLSESLDQTGRDPMPEFQAALHSYERAVAIVPQCAYAWSRQADLHVAIADHNTAIGLDPRPAIDSARRAGEQGLRIDPSSGSLLDTMAHAQLVLAHYLVETGGDPTAALVSARGYLDRAEIVHPGHMVTWFYRLLAAGTEAKFRLREGADPTNSIATGRAALKEALRLEPDSADSYVEAARLDLVEAAWAAHTGRGAGASLAGAQANAEKAIALDGQSAEAKLTAAEVFLQIATARPSHAVIERGIAYVDQTLAQNPRLARTQTLRTALLRLRVP